MRVLITGGNRFINSCLAFKFLDEGHDVVILGKLYAEEKFSGKLRNKIYNISPANTECEKIFEAYRFYIVIYVSEWFYGYGEYDQSDSYTFQEIFSESDGIGKKELNKKFSDVQNPFSVFSNSAFLNILNLSAKTGVKKFIYISTAEIYGIQESFPITEDSKPNPINVNGMSDFIREYYCSKWQEIYGLKTLSIRVSDIYGPGFIEFSNKALVNSKNIINSLIEGVLKKNEIKVNFNPDFTRDFIYIDDAVDGIYKASLKRDCIGILNLSSNTETPIKKVVELISNIKKTKRIYYEKKDLPKALKANISSSFHIESKQIERCWLDNSKIKSLIEWQPATNLEEGIKKTIEWKENNLKLLTKKSVKREKKLKTQNMLEKSSAFISEDQISAALETGLGKVASLERVKAKTALAFFENILLFLFFAFLQFGELFFNVKLPDLKIDLLIVYIILVGVLWGQVQAYFALALAVVTFVAVSIFNNVDIITFIYTPENIVQIAIYILVGIIAGYTIEKKNREIEARDLNYKSLKNKYSFLLNVYNETKIIKDELEDRIIDAEDSFSSIYKIVQEVDSLEIERVFSGAVKAIEKIMKTDKVSIYIFSSNGGGNFLRLKARSLMLEGKIPNSIKVSDFPQIIKVIETKSIYVNKNFEPGIPLMISPVLDGRRVIAIISIHDAEFENLTVHYENLFTTVVNLITNAIKRAYIFESSLRDKRYLPKTKILTEETFEKVLTEVRRNREELNMSYSLLKVLNSNEPLSEISEKIFSNIRENDYAGLSSDGSLYIMLSNTKNNYAGIVIDRLAKVGIKSVLVQEDFVNE